MPQLPENHNEYWAGYIDARPGKSPKPREIDESVIITSHSYEHLECLVPYFPRKIVRKVKNNQVSRFTFPADKIPKARLFNEHYLRGWFDAKSKTIWKKSRKRITITSTNFDNFIRAYENVFRALPHIHRYSADTKSRRWQINGHAAEIFLGIIYSKEVFNPLAWPSKFPVPHHLVSRITKVRGSNQ